jgi:4-oxalocrotonate tautomerase
VPSGYWISASRWEAKTKEAVMPLVQVKVIKGVFDSNQKQDMISQLTETMVNIEGEALRGVTWVTIDEVESGDWGIGGNAITAQYVKDLQKAPAAAR